MKYLHKIYDNSSAIASIDFRFGFPPVRACGISEWCFRKIDANGNFPSRGCAHTHTHTEVSGDYTVVQCGQNLANDLWNADFKKSQFLKKCLGNVSITDFKTKDIIILRLNFCSYSGKYKINYSEVLNDAVQVSTFSALPPTYKTCHPCQKLSPTNLSTFHPSETHRPRTPRSQVYSGSRMMNAGAQFPFQKINIDGK